MARRQPRVGVRLSVEDAEQAIKALKSFGIEGQQALEKIERASRKARPELKAVDTAAKEMRGTFDELADRAGVLGRVLNKLGPAGTAAAVGMGASLAVAYKFVQIAPELNELQGRLVALQTGFNNLAQRDSRDGVQLITDLGVAAHGTLSQIELLTVANTALNANVRLLSDNLPEVARQVREVSTAWCAT